MTVDATPTLSPWRPACSEAACSGQGREVIGAPLLSVPGLGGGVRPAQPGAHPSRSPRDGR
eukprot:2043508-Pleurochrysis_carterae.AAC.1